ncbi:hypothetical protein EHS25_003357 [Saitozyma podzolica]|uniref:RraA-like protein n=1 Tax=Saitozyma podzolica TaxID=1890683 RepID=A0A427Y902_9TREE|nr:hypothetical protein EHS25_003357 [Saitozyma podzolica]
MSKVDHALITRLKRLSACQVSDALVKSGIAHGGLITDMNAYSLRDEGMRIAGPAFTVKMVHASDTTSPKPSQHFVDACPANHVLLIQAPVGLRTTPLHPRPIHLHPPSTLSEPLTIHPLPPASEPPFPSITVSPGDYLLCDVDGCVAIPAGRVEEVVDLAEKMGLADEKVREDLEKGGGVAESMARWRGK